MKCTIVHFLSKHSVDTKWQFDCGGLNVWKKLKLRIYVCFWRRAKNQSARSCVRRHTILSSNSYPDLALARNKTSSARGHEAVKVGYIRVFCIGSCFPRPAWCSLVSCIQDSVIWLRDPERYDHHQLFLYSRSWRLHAHQLEHQLPHQTSPNTFPQLTLQPNSEG